MIYIACALHCEAKPLVDTYKLKLDRSAAYPLFFNQSMKLVVSGVGQMEMASAVSYLYAHAGEVSDAAWLNIGIAGHAHYAVGSLLNINKVNDEATRKNWYPGRIEGMPGINCGLRSVASPDLSYSGQCAVDMESAAFMRIVQRYTLLDLVQVIKIVSDNCDTDITKIEKAYVTSLILEQISQIKTTIALLMLYQEKFSAIYTHDVQLQRFLRQCHFSQYQEKELAKLLRKASALALDLSPFMQQDRPSANSILESLHCAIDKAELRY